jgi:hypothetical protein
MSVIGVMIGHKASDEFPHFCGMRILRITIRMETIVAGDGTQHELLDGTQQLQAANHGTCETHSSLHLRLNRLREFIALHRGDINVLQTIRCGFKHRDFDILFSFSGCESASTIQSIVVSAVVCNADEQRKQAYTLMTRVMRINTGLRDMKISRLRGEIVAFRLIDASLLYREEGRAFQARLCDFLIHVVRIEKELSTRS